MSQNSDQSPVRCLPLLTWRRTLPSIGLLIAISACGCQQYGEVSPKAYQVATALYSVCNQKNAARLDKVEPLIAEAATTGELSTAEAQWLRDIVAAGRSGEWEVAAQDARTMLEEQNR